MRRRLPIDLLHKPEEDRSGGTRGPASFFPLSSSRHELPASEYRYSDGEVAGIDHRRANLVLIERSRIDAQSLNAVLLELLSSSAVLRKPAVHIPLPPRTVREKSGGKAPASRSTSRDRRGRRRGPRSGCPARWP